MDKDEINYKTLRKIQQIEEKTSILSKIDKGYQFTDLKIS